MGENRVYLSRCLSKAIRARARVYTTYGILAARDLRGCQQVVQFISDVSLDRAFVEALARRCTAAQLDPCHLLDVVEDAISG